MGQAADPASLAGVDEIYPLLASADRFVRWSGRLALKRLPVASWRERALADTTPLSGIEALVALVEAAPADGPAVLERSAALIRKGGLSRSNQVRLLRTLQLAAIATPDPPAALRSSLFEPLAGQFPSGDRSLDRELAVTLAWTGQPGAIDELLQAMPDGSTDQPLQIHYVYALRTIAGGWTAAQKAQLTEWFGRALTWRGGASFPGYLNLLFDDAVKAAGYSTSEQQAAYAALPQFAPLTAAEASAGGRGRSSPPAAARGRGSRTISREELFDELIYTPQRNPPSAEAGREVYAEACAACHRFGDSGRDVGPDLTTVSSRFKKRDLVEAMLWPSRVISDQYASTLIELADGSTVSGMIVSEDADKVVLRTPGDPERPVAVAKSRIARRESSPVSLMPEGLVDGMSNQQIANLLAFLQADADRP
jgi:putative heme-binding domain-containing protein